ncbi:hypothetical protein GH714_004550 [Hevea brasiliensis]|uniref:Uncharacterized protein n=1 Tax=Hevea brasiliensis TaxID=3981 RepID=A0A6A6LA52_HEVBR|nr:hypothetical protein GH714_004550 [Hevea brasiliensis]
MVDMDLYVKAEASEVLSAASVVDKVLSNGLELEVGRVLAVEKSSLAGDCDAKQVGDLLKKKKEIGDHFGTDSLTIEAIGKESQSSKVSEAIYLKAKYRETKNKFSGLILLSEEAEMQELKAPTNAKESEAVVVAKGKRSIESLSSKRSSESSGGDYLHGDLEDTSPVVRSKRGRSQVLPSRYGDSVVLTPWKRVVRSQGTAAAPMVPNK